MTWNLDAVLEDPALSPQAKFVYAELAGHADDHGRDYAAPGVKKLARSMGRSEPTASTALRELVNAGHVVRQRRGQGLPDAIRPTATAPDAVSHGRTTNKHQEVAI